MTPAARLRERAWTYVRDAERLQAMGMTTESAMYGAIASELRAVADEVELAPEHPR